MATQYSPQRDSSPTASDFYTDPSKDNDPGFDADTTLVLVVEDSDHPLCYCGCEGVKKNAKSGKAEAGFIQGHDQALKGKLIRAGRNHVEVVMAGNALISGEALGMAHHFGLTPKGIAQVAAGIARPAKATSAARPAATTFGEIKIGRWTYPTRTQPNHPTERNTKRDGSGEWVTV